MRAALAVLLHLTIFFLKNGHAQLPAFPGAEGAGKFVTGGRGGDVYRVTNCNASGPGSFLEGIKTAPSFGRTIVFDVSGNISFSSTLKIDRNNLTIAGQTAPGKGICIKDGRTAISGSNVILRHIRFRPSIFGGDGDALQVQSKDVIVDHCSASWSSDEVLSTGNNPVTNFTVQNCLIYEGLDTSYHYENGILIPHSMGSLFSTTLDSARFSILRNLYAHNRTRNPKPTVSLNFLNLFFDFRNNVIFNWGSKCGYSTEDTTHRIHMNYIGNYCVAGPSTKISSRYEVFEGMTAGTKIHQAQNKIDGNVDGVRNGQNTGWSMFTGSFSPFLTPFSIAQSVTTSADSAYESVLKYAGAFWWNRDSADSRVVRNVRTDSGRIINLQSDVGGWEILPVVYRPAGWDTDGDGMPDYWEAAHGLNPAVSGDGNALAQNGYTNLENYLNSMELTNPVEVNESSSVSDRDFHVHPVYPNPCNGQLQIRYRTNGKEKIAIKVFNALGKEFDSRFLGEPAEGTHTFNYSFDGNDFPTGIYYFTFSNGAEKSVRKVVLLK